MTAASKADLSLAANFELLSRFVDINNFIDYLIINFYIGKSDWPTNKCVFPSKSSAST